MPRASRFQLRTPTANQTFAFSVIFFCLLLGHNIFKLGGSFSLVQILTLALICLTPQRSAKAKVALSAAMVLILSGLQYLVVGDNIMATNVDLFWKYPILVIILISFFYVSASLIETRYIEISTVEAVAWLVLLSCLAAASVSYFLGLIYFPQIYYDNPNETAVAVGGAYLYIAFASRSKSAYIWGFLLAAPAVYLGSSRYSLIYVAAIFALAALPAIHANLRTDAAMARREAVGQFLIAAIFLALSLDLSYLNRFFQFVSFDRFGIELEALWLGWDAVTPVVSSIGYRVNNVLAAIGALVGTFGLGIGLGRSAALTEQISGLAGSIHVSPVEFVTEFGLYGTAGLLALNAYSVGRKSVVVFSSWMALGMMGMFAQSSAYLTSYVAWFFIVTLAFLKARQAEADSRPG